MVGCDLGFPRFRKMKISKILTSSFAISANVERNILEKYKKDKISKRYLPLGIFKVSRTEEVKKGILFKRTSFDKRENFFYVDLTFCDLYYFHRGSGFGRAPKLNKSDFIKRIIDFRDEVISTIGQLYEYGSIEYDLLNSNIVSELQREGFVEIHEPELDQIVNLFRYYLEDDAIMRKYFVKLHTYLPNFGNARYNIESFLETSDTVDETYEKDQIKYSHERVSEVLGMLFNGKVLLKGLIYLPYLACVSSADVGHTVNIYYPICSRGDPNTKRGFSTEVKLEPVSFMTKMDVIGSIPIEAPTINFSNVADLEEVKKQISESIVYPLTNPELAKKFGKKPGGSILFYGPPGCGKTYIARATVGECGVAFFNINTSDILSGGAESGAKNIHEAFQRAAQNSPAILFFDEIDALGGRREFQIGDQKIVVNQFLMEMDGVESLNENVLVIGATNAPWDIDPALRRAGRFTDHIFIPPPDHKTRAEVFKIHTRKKPVSSDINFEKLSELTEGFSSADIKAICDDALEIPWDEALHGAPLRKAKMDDFLSVLQKRKSSLGAWYKLAEKEIRKSGEVSLFEDLSKYILMYAGGIDQIVKPDITFKDVANLENVKEKINKAIVYPLTNPELAKKFGKEVGGSILLYGPPGCGKTYISRATSGECSAAFFNVKITDIISDSEPEKRIQEIFERARRNSPAILFIDELDALAGKRSMEGPRKTLVNQLLTELDGFESNKGIMVIGSTNAPWDIDPALRRAGRFTEQVYIPLPDSQTIIDIFKLHTKNKPISNVNFEKLAELTEGFSSADIKAICDHALEIPWAEAYHGGAERAASMSDFLSAIKGRKSSIIPWFSMAEQQIMKSGETDMYSDILEDIKKFHKTRHEKEKIKVIVTEEREKILAEETIKKKELLNELHKKRKEVEEAIKIIKLKLKDKKIDKESFIRVISDYEKQLIDLEIKIRNLENENK